MVRTSARGERTLEPQDRRPEAFPFKPKGSGQFLQRRQVADERGETLRRRSILLAAHFAVPSLMNFDADGRVLHRQARPHNTPLQASRR